MVDTFNLLDALIEQYLALKVQEDDIVSRKNDIATQIKQLLENEPNGKYETPSGVKATLVEKTTFKYTDEIGILSYLSMKGLKDSFTSNKIDTTKFNAELKAKGSLYNAVKDYITESKQKSLTVTGGSHGSNN